MATLETYPGQKLDESTLSLASVLNGSDTGDLSPALGSGLSSAADWSEWWSIKNPIAGQTIAVLPDVSVLDYGGGNGIVQDTLAFGAVTLYQAYKTTQNGQTTVSFTPIATSTPQSDPILAAQHPGYTMNDSWEKMVIPTGNSGSGWLNEFYLSVSGGSGYLDTVYGPSGVSIPDEGRFLVTTGTITGARDAAWGNWQDVITVGGGTTGDTTTGGGTTNPFPDDPAGQIDFALSGVDPSQIPQATVVPSDTGHPQRDALATWWDNGGEGDFTSGSPFSLIDTFAQGRAKLSALYQSVQSFADGDLPDYVYNNRTDDAVRNLTTNFERDVSKPLTSIIKDAITNSIGVKSTQENFRGIKGAMFTYLNGLLGIVQDGLDQLHPRAAELAAQLATAAGEPSTAVRQVGDRQDVGPLVVPAIEDHLGQGR